MNCDAAMDGCLIAPSSCIQTDAELQRLAAWQTNYALSQIGLYNLISRCRRSGPSSATTEYK